MNENRRKFLKDSSFAVATLTIPSLLFSRHVCAGSMDLPESCTLQGKIGDYDIDLLSTSGNRDLDRSINLELGHIANSFTVLPGFAFYDDSDGANAFATNETWIPNTRGTMVFGKQLLSDELGNTWGGLAVAGIIAHEFGHIYQYQSQYFKLLTKLQSNDKLLELHADFLAGYYLGLKRLRGVDFDIKVFADSLYTRGDTDFNSRQHHGTPLERRQVLIEGYKIGLVGEIAIHQAAEAGMNFVKNI